MCFYNDDCDWSADHIEDTSGPSPMECKCDECGDKIPVGAWRFWQFAQEHEECQICQDDCSDSFIDRTDAEEHAADDDPDNAEYGREMLKTLAEHKCTFGESDTYVRCEACEKVLLAIDEHERKAGCPAHARQPSLGQLWDELCEHSDAPIYIREAVAVFPEIASHEHVGRYLAEVE